MDSVTKTSANGENICRCCLVEGCYKDIHTEYYYSGRREVYEEMLSYTFDIQIPYTESSSGQLENSNCMICDDCVTILRQAYRFKDMVKQSVEVFANILDKQLNSCNEESTTQDLELKVEDIKDEDLVDADRRYDEEIYHNDDGDCDSNEQILKIENNKTKAEKKNSQLKKDREKDKVKKDWLKIAERRGNGPLLRENSIKLISNSTICVFQWNKSRYRCFCCMEPFSDMNLLRDHTNNAHTLENIKKKIIIQQNRLDSLRRHLKRAHAGS
ncbi:zinc-finger associated domain (zf-AD) domain-containing protein [Phthorimaea operculella]|nr:zinc-finger associated domain (zf-AD) domain-containing protein [Phthorimaea operculella]